MALGNAIHEGVAFYYTALQGGPADRTAIRAGAHDIAAVKIAEEFREGSEWSLDGLRKLVTKGMQVALDTPLLSDDGSVVGAELWAAHSKIDLVTREPFGLVVTDHKVKLELEKRRLEYALRDLNPSWQLLHEAWAVRAKYGECPTWARAHLIALGPRPFTYVHSEQITDERLDDFQQSGEFHWSAMAGHADAEAMEGKLPPMNTRSCWQYGRKCDFYELCHLYGGDMTKAPALYEPYTEEDR
jgi:hypothetical protein